MARFDVDLSGYSGCDRRGISIASSAAAPSPIELDPLFEIGQLQVARFDADGTGVWLALTPEAKVDPFRPSRFTSVDLSCPVELPHSDRVRAGAELMRDDAAVEAYCRRFSTLADLYRGEGEALQGAILVDAHLAASAIGATPTGSTGGHQDRPIDR